MRKYAFLVLLTVCLCSCTKNEWWLGTWRIDKTYSESKNKDVKGDMSGMVASMVFGIFSNADFVLTKDQVMITRNGSGTAKPCKIISVPSDSSVVLQIGDQISTYSLENGFMAITVAGAPEGMKFYFKRAEQGAAANP